MSEIVLETIGNRTTAELGPRGTSCTMVENLVTRLDTMMENTVIGGSSGWSIEPITSI